jgi:sugar (pentulose or hexulose) kinase
MMPSLHRASDQLGTLRAGVAAATGLPEACMVACGIHDSNASYLRFLMDREREAFTVVSSGTWTIVMANRGELRRLREERDMLANVNVFGAPIATARYMGGREYEAIAQGSDEPTVDALIEVLSRGAMALPSFASAGPYSGRTGTIDGGAGFNGPQRAALATLYSALMTAQLIESLGTAGEIFIDGPLSRNPLFGALLGACVPVGTVRTYPEGGGTRVAAHLAGLPSPQQVALRNVAPLRIAGLLEYQASWRHRLEDGS